MKLLFVTAADYANVEMGGKLNIMGLFNKINARQFPWIHPEMHLVVSLVAAPSEYGMKRQLTIKLMDEDASKTLMTLSGEVQIPQGEGGRAVEINSIFKLNNVKFPDAGTYQFAILVDHDEMGTFRIDALQRTPG